MKEKEEMTQEIKQRIDYWLTGPFDETTKEEIKDLKKKDPQKLIDAFSSDLNFGTGGLRALMGVGTCHINNYTIRQASQGLANYLHKHSSTRPLSIVIGFDSRHHSQEFAEEAAQVFAANHIRTYLFDTLRPTPYVSFACRFKHASAAVMITASHNPKEYNGYKVYWSDGAQVVAPHDRGIVKEVSALTDMSMIQSTSVSNPLIERVDVAHTLDQQYLKAIAPLQLFPKENQAFGHTLKIAYTSLHGTGITLAPQALKSWGFTQIEYVEEQIKPDPEFPTVKFPNPEYEQALEMGVALLKKTDADLLIANDPDADRIGIVCMHEEKPIVFNGNEIAAICVHYLCQVLTASQKMPEKAAFITTIVSTELIGAIAKKYGALCYEVLTGFKYIGEKIHEWEREKNSPTFIFGAEESYGYLLGTHARDKDAIVSSCLIAEIALYAKLHKKTLKNLLDEIYQEYGIYREKQFSLEFEPGHIGMQQMKHLMDCLRNTQIECFSSPVVYVEDYNTHTRIDSNGKTTPLHLPSSDVLLYRLEDKTRLVIRPSGTEPKLKIYASVHLSHFPSIEEGMSQAEKQLDDLLHRFQQTNLHLKL